MPILSELSRFFVILHQIICINLDLRNGNFTKIKRHS